MKAMIYTKYGSPDILELTEVEKPTPRGDEVLVKLHAVSLNSSDWEFLTAKSFIIRLLSGLLKPKYTILGSDIAGRVETVGKDVKQFQPGDEVYGDIFMRWGGFAEYVCASEDTLMKKPACMTFEEAAAMPQAGTLALQGLRDKGQVKTGQNILINGAGGGAGTFAIQIAKSYGAEVTGVDNAGKLDMMRRVGADHVIDYTKEDFTRNGKSYDLILDFAAYRSIFHNKRGLAPKGIYVFVGGSMAWAFQILCLGPLIKKIGGQEIGILSHHQNKKDMALMADLFERGTVVPIIDRCYTFSEAAKAFRYLGEGKAQGKVVITMETCS
ncbi:MAG: NAD(P)-dependent alcohol dehydrogenase [Emcibacter sp.]|nr:NAD(P)-dependent alcohol dehydrogenase [Emcibacter sp.]